MKLSEFPVRNYRNIIDSGWVRLEVITAFVGQNESGKSNLCEALFRLNPFDASLRYNIDVDWPADDWGGRDESEIVCEANYQLTAEEIESLISPQEDSASNLTIPESMTLTLQRNYKGQHLVKTPGDSGWEFGQDYLTRWVLKNAPRCVFIKDYEMPGTQIELDHLASKLTQVGSDFNRLTNEEQTIAIVLKLANINISDFVQKGQNSEGRTLRSFDKRQASAYLSRQFSRLWKQKEVRFDIDIDATTLNIFAEDVGLGMPVRLSSRSTGFRWYVAFAWKLTHASGGDYKNCVILLEEPGIHLHHGGHADLLSLFEELSETNTIVYTTHLATLLDPAYPERIRIVEVQEHHAVVRSGVVSGQRQPMMVIEAALGLRGSMAGLLGNRSTLIVEGGDDVLFLQNLSGVLRQSDREGLNDDIYLWPAQTASKTPMYAAFLIGHGWKGAVLVDSDEEGRKAKKKIGELYLAKLESGGTFRVLLIGEAAETRYDEAAIEDLFPEQFYLNCVNDAYGLAISLSDLPQDGSKLITKRIEGVLKTRYGRSGLDKGRVMVKILVSFSSWKKADDLPEGVADRAEALFKKINAVFATD